MRTFQFVAALGLVAAPALASGTGQTKLASDESKVVCKRTGETGSLARVKKQCLTKKQWRHLEEASREQAREMQTSVPGQSN